VIGEHFIDHSCDDICEHGVGALVVRQGDQRDGKRPAATTRPSRIVDRQHGAEDVAGLGGEETPRAEQVARGITYGHTAEVDDCAELALFYEEVAR
jgi:hypothetical protein